MASKKPRGKRGQKKTPSRERSCDYPECGRPRASKKLCAAHYRQRLTRGELTTIRPYRARVAGTAKYAGLRLSQDCIEQVDGLARSRGLSHGGALEGWLSEGAKPSPPVSGGASPGRGQRE
jgi:hypothetical protein